MVCASPLPRQALGGAVCQGGNTCEEPLVNCIFFPEDTMTSKKPQTKVSSWVVSSFSDFDLSSSPPADKKIGKRSRDTGGRNDGRQKRLQASQQLQGRSALWVDLYAPSTQEDLAVHKRKVLEVESWLVESSYGRKGRKLLLLTGPAGCGKSATVRVLAREAKLNLVEWTNPTTTPYNNNFMEQENVWRPDDTVVPVSQTTQFWEFLMRCSKYNSVCTTDKRENLVCVEDFPNAILRDPASFHTMLRKYSQWSNSSPVVFIVTDSTNQYGNVKRLFPPDLVQELSIVSIGFNPIASGLLVKALNRILSIESAGEGGLRLPLPSKEVLQSLTDASGGDIRSAINALQFATKKDVSKIGGLFTGPSKKDKPGSRGKSSTKSKPAVSSEDAHVAVGGKDASLFLFRALGKVLYCKRDLDKGIVDTLPEHLKKNERLPLQENPESIFEKTSMGASSFSLFLHQNYLNFFSDIECVAKAAHYLSDSDVLTADWMERDVLEGYSASVTARGLMHPNKDGTSGGAWRPITRPQWYAVTKKMQEHSLAIKEEHCKHSLTTEELMTILVPFKCRILPGSSHTFCEVGLLSSSQRIIYTERLGEKDVSSIGTEAEEVDRTAPSVLPGPPTVSSSSQVEEDPDEELTIEDPDDD
ncbi:Cell cycle checkpoint protein RAD17 [Portunus trituberculatus]|uniref:Cell cycle checkpoint protein RAD17 n=1 Tax=Portunus trituberculatus TaxID=210409 RepID=A0A5B7D0X2_PORTR|nr:Cell cycle checkpoint protein RAD17 [Portunus trituberculatus]